MGKTAQSLDNQVASLSQVDEGQSSQGEGNKAGVEQHGCGFFAFL